MRRGGLLWLQHCEKLAAVHLIHGCHSSVSSQNLSMSIQHSSGVPSIDLPPSSFGTNLQSSSSQPATAQPASAASGSSQHGASAGVLPSSQLVGPSGGCFNRYLSLLLLLLLFLLLLLWHLGVCRNTFLVGPLYRLFQFAIHHSVMVLCHSVARLAYCFVAMLL